MKELAYVLDPRRIGFRLLTMADLELLYSWLNQTPAVKEFYGHGEETPYAAVVAKYSPRIRGEEPTTSYIIQYDRTPIGYIQAYRWRDYMDYARYLDLQEEAMGLDLFIGHPDYLQRGLGSHVLRAFVHQVIFAAEDVASCVITPEVRHTGALRAYDKAGFQRLRVLEHPDEPGPVWVIRLGRVDFPPRARYLTAPLRVQEMTPPEVPTDLAEQLSPEVGAVTGPIRRVTLPQQGVCNLLLRVEAEQGEFALKLARAGYRSQELWAEHTIMQQLQGSRVPVPRSLLFERQGEYSLQLREFAPGEPLSAVLAADPAIRHEAIRQMGETLAAMHAIWPTGTRTWEEWADASLEHAARNLAAGVCDPADFTPDAPPAEVLEWLRRCRPAGGGTVGLLHGDYRPKNQLWQDGKVTAVIDWAFADVGDPYYDLSIIHWYMQNEAEWQQFLAAYGLRDFDPARFAWCRALHKFLNV